MLVIRRQWGEWAAGAEFHLRTQAVSQDVLLLLLSELQARLAFGETCDLRHIEKQGAQGVGCVGVERLQTAPESSVAVTVRSGERRVVAEPVETMAGLHLVRTMVVRSAAFVFQRVGTQIVIVDCYVPWSAPFRVGVYKPPLTMVVCSVPFATSLGDCHEVCNFNLANSRRVGLLYHSPYCRPVTVQDARGFYTRDGHQADHRRVCHEHDAPGEPRHQYQRP